MVRCSEIRSITSANKLHNYCDMSSHSDTFTFNSGFLGYSRSGGFGVSVRLPPPLQLHCTFSPAAGPQQSCQISDRSETSESEDLRCHCHLKPNHIIVDLDRIVADVAVWPLQSVFVLQFNSIKFTSYFLKVIFYLISFKLLKIRHIRIEQRMPQFSEYSSERREKRERYIFFRGWPNFFPTGGRCHQSYCRLLQFHSLCELKVNNILWVFRLDLRPSCCCAICWKEKN